MNQNNAFRYLHIGVPDDIARLQGVGDFHEAIRRIDEKLAGELPMATVSYTHLTLPTKQVV